MPIQKVWIVFFFQDMSTQKIFGAKFELEIVGGQKCTFAHVGVYGEQLVFYNYTALLLDIDHVCGELEAHIITSYVYVRIMRFTQGTPCL